MPSVKYEKRQLIIAQALREIQFARTYKQGKIKNWQINEDLYYGKKLGTDETSRANVDLGRMQEFVHTLLSKIDNPLVFRYVKTKIAQLQRVENLNGVRIHDQATDNWDIKDLVGKKQAVIYGRAIYSYYADSENGYQAHLDNVDVYDFLIDPSAGGIDMDRASYLGDYGVVMSRQQLKKGVRNGDYLKKETEELLAGSGNAGDVSQEVTNTYNRTQAQNTTTVVREISDADKFKFWRWGTTFEGKRYYLLLSEKGGTAVRVEELKDVFKSEMWWYWSYAVFPDLTEFWTPSYCDYVREIFMAQGVSINQMLDNAEEINKPQKVVNVTQIKNLAQLKYQRGGNYITAKGTDDVAKSIQLLRPPSIDTPLRVFEALEKIQEKASGVNANAKGTSDEDKVGIYEGNQANTADRFGLLNKSYAFGYTRFSTLHRHGVDEHLTTKMAVEILGPDGVEMREVSRRDIFRKGEKFGVQVEASNAEVALSEVEKRTKIAFLNAEAQNPALNKQKAFEVKARIAGFEDDDIRQLMDTSEFGDASTMAEAERDIERIIDGETIKPNANANTAYKARFVDYMAENEENLKPEQVKDLFAYVESLDDIIVENMVRKAQQEGLKMKLKMIAEGTVAPNGGPPKEDVTETRPAMEVAPETEIPPEEADMFALKT